METGSLLLMVPPLHRQFLYFSLFPSEAAQAQPTAPRAGLCPLPWLFGPKVNAGALHWPGRWAGSDSPAPTDPRSMPALAADKRFCGRAPRSAAHGTEGPLSTLTNRSVMGSCFTRAQTFQFLGTNAHRPRQEAPSPGAFNRAWLGQSRGPALPWAWHTDHNWSAPE